jgi:hypothetical protein
MSNGRSRDESGLFAHLWPSNCFTECRRLDLVWSGGEKLRDQPRLAVLSRTATSRARQFIELPRRQVRILSLLDGLATLRRLKAKISSQGRPYGREHDLMRLLITLRDM